MKKSKISSWDPHEYTFRTCPNQVFQKLLQSLSLLPWLQRLHQVLHKANHGMKQLAHHEKVKAKGVQYVTTAHEFLNLKSNEEIKDQQLRSPRIHLQNLSQPSVSEAPPVSVSAALASAAAPGPAQSKPWYETAGASWEGKSKGCPIRDNCPWVLKS